ncbi:hypothetical protein ATJ88_3563 [Isoptericola jiangsuensis]|uniref:DUF2076 domain-containing protein n=1 Tax=Isoptericola jiangsuensis TaxID=548579 RepID=A0A2A9F1Y0_9MICO|nr:hypothetical protein [Isoptericola jiangsuensis]PFG44826.1 hypothetical protein ATJ88_3563 [Isoptericola jiangsuensis]
MGFLDRLLGRSDDRHPSVPGMTGGSVPRGYSSPTQAPRWQQGAPAPAAPRDPDDVAIDRYRYLLRTAPPDAVEQAHAEAFAQLTPEQRRKVLADLGATVPPAERATSDDPQSLARMATRAEMRSPGTLERTFRGGPGGAPGFGAMVGSSLLGTVAGVVIGSAVANMLFGPAFGDPTTPVAEDDAAAAGEGDPGAEDPGAADAGADVGGDVGAADAGAGTDDSLFGGFFGGDGGGDFGGDFGGGDFGGF